MLRGIHPVLSPDLLHALASMGHGDELAVVDSNFPAASNAQRLIRIDGAMAAEVLQATLSLMPLDTYCAEGAAFSMQVVDKPGDVPAIVETFQGIIDSESDHPSKIVALKRFDFYDRAKTAFAIVATAETRLYGNLIVRKGVVDPGELS